MKREQLIGWPGAASADRATFQRGQTLVVAAVMLVGLIGMLALVIDMGNIYSQRRFMQNAADAAALAGARALALEQDVDRSVFEYAVTHNGAEQYEYAIVGHTVAVTVHKSFPTYFAGVVGVPTARVSAAAVAGYSPVQRMKDSADLMPVTVRQDMWAPGQIVRIWADDKGVGDPQPGDIWDGQRGWLNFDGGAVADSEVEEWIRYGYRGPVWAGMWINGTPGVKAASLIEFNTWRLGKDVVVPIFDVVEEDNPGHDLGSGQLDYHIVGFAVFHVTHVKHAGNPKYVEGYFLRSYIPSGGGGGDDDAPSFGPYAIRLLR
ncbi:MAG: hypothetical protein K6V36_00175 [Anaerolineae bacterium]|nr:hypothetical protein [Anaerolineae bacterium]